MYTVLSIIKENGEQGLITFEDGNIKLLIDAVYKYVAEEKAYKGSNIQFNIEGTKMTMLFSGLASGEYEDTYKDIIYNVTCNYNMTIVFEIIDGELYSTSEIYNLTNGTVSYLTGEGPDEEEHIVEEDLEEHIVEEDLEETYENHDQNWIGDSYNDLVKLLKHDFIYYINLDMLDVDFNIENKYLKCVTSNHIVKRK